MDYTSVHFYLSPDVNVHSRQIYTIWDLLGDVGGLLDFLKLLISPFLSFLAFISGTGFDTHIVESIFKVQKKVDLSTSIFDVIKRRKKLKIAACSWGLDKCN